MKRLYTIDAVRGAAVIAMIVFHALWDLCYMFRIAMPAYTSKIEEPLGIAIGVTFIFVSGFSFGLGKRHLRRALQVLGGALAVALVTMVVMPRMPIYFGVLSLLGSMMLFMIPLSFIIKRINPYISLAVFLFLFIFLFSVPQGTVTVHAFTFKLPRELYSNMLSAYFGFPPSSFISSDYYPILPWGFLYMAGYSAYLIFKRLAILDTLAKIRFRPLEWIGRHAFIIYLLHQPIIYAVLYLTLK